MSSNRAFLAVILAASSRIKVMHPPLLTSLVHPLWLQRFIFASCLTQISLFLKFEGCCSLCARICHKGHDIGYSRKSSFFCDCGAEVATAIEQKRTSCKCLTPLSEDVIIREFYQDESEVNHELESIQQAHYDSDVFIELMAKSFSSEFNDSLKNMVEEATKSDWRESILLILNQTYQTAASPSSIDFSVLLNSTFGTQTISGVGCPNLQSRSAQPLTITRLYSSCLLPVRAAKASSLQSRLISGSSSTTSHTRKTRNDYHVQALAADNRGRLYIAESTTVIFCSSIPSVNVRYVDNSPASHLSRSQLSILGTDHVKFAIRYVFEVYSGNLLPSDIISDPLMCLICSPQSGMAVSFTSSTI